MNKAQIGTVIAGTLRSEDLVQALAGELQWLSATDRTTEETNLLAEVGDFFDLFDPADEDSDLVNMLMDALNARAPEGCYFGAHEGDGSDFGFWPLDPGPMED